VAPAIFLGLLAAGAVLLVLVDRRRTRRPTQREDSGALDYINLFIATVYMVLLSLIVVVMWSNISDLGGSVRAEAAALNTLVETADRMPPAEGLPLRAAARDYADSVLAGEWPAPRAADPADLPAAHVLEQARSTLARPVAAGTRLDTVEDQAIADIDTVLAARADRLAKSGDGVPTFLLVTLAGLSLVTAATPLALGLRADAAAFAGFALATTLVGLAFWFVLDLRSPYHGLIHVDPQPLRTVAVLDPARGG
jgi:hypothetical protein